MLELLSVFRVIGLISLLPLRYFLPSESISQYDLALALDTGVMTPFCTRSAITLSPSASYLSGTLLAYMTFLGSVFGLRFILILSPFIGFGFRSSLIVLLNFCIRSCIMLLSVHVIQHEAVPNSMF